MKDIRVQTASLLPQLRKVHLFRHLSDESIGRLLDLSSFEEYAEGEYFIRENQIETKVFVILSGAAAVMVAQDGVDTYVATLGAGQVVGEAALFSRFPRTASVVAQDTCRVMVFERTRFLTVLRDEPDAGIRILFVMVHTLLDKLREVNLELAFERRENQSQDDVDALIEDLLGSK